MSKNFLLNLDLISREIFSEGSLALVGRQILEMEEGNQIATSVSEIVQLTKDGRIEIYLENEGIEEDSPEEILSFVKKLESNLGGFIPGSCFEWIREYPSSTRRWIRKEYSWELEEEGEEKTWGEDTYGEDGWEEWNKEWN